MENLVKTAIILIILLSGRGRLKESGHTPNISLQIYETTSKPLDISLVTSLVCDLLLQFPVTIAGPHVTC